MSYCRWSSDGGQCDLYCYEDVNGGFTTHVAGRRRHPPPDNLIDPYGPLGIKMITGGKPGDWKTTNEKWQKYLETAGFDLIISPHAGMSYNDPTIEEFRDRIVELSKDKDLKVPVWLLGSINEEIIADAITNSSDEGTQKND